MRKIGKNKVVCSRVRVASPSSQDQTVVQFFSLADNLGLGAATTAVNILAYLVKNRPHF